MKGMDDMAREPLDGRDAGEAAPAPAPAMTVRGAAFLGVGSMVGAGIFALLGEAGAVAGSAVWLSFLLAGVVATLQGYAVAKLGARYPSSGGIVTFLLQGYGRGHITAIASLGSAVALGIFVVTSIAAYRLRHETASRASILVTAIALTVVVLVVFAVQTLKTSPETFVAMIGIVALAVALEMFWSAVRARRASHTQ